MKQYRLTLRLLPGRYSIWRLPPDAPIPAWATEAPVFSVTRTPDELSVVCPERTAPSAVTDNGWRILQAAGPFPLDVTGVLHSLTEPLARASIPLFALSTYDTDYLLVREPDLSRAAEALRAAGHTVND